MGRRKIQINGERKTQQQLSDEYRRRTYCNADLLSRIFAYIGMDAFPTTERPTNRNSPEFDEYNAHLDRIVKNLFEKYREQFMNQDSQQLSNTLAPSPRSRTPSISEQKQQFNALASANKPPKTSPGSSNHQCSYVNPGMCGPNCSYSFSPTCDSTFTEPYMPNQTQCVTHATASFPPPNFVQSSNSPPNFIQSSNAPSPVNFVQPQQQFVPPGTYPQQTNSNEPKMDNYDRAFFDWLDEQIFESHTFYNKQYPHNQQTNVPGAVQSHQTFSCSFDDESGIESRHPSNSVPPTHFDQQMYNFDSMHQAVGSNTIRRAESDSDSSYSDLSDDNQKFVQTKITSQFTELQPAVPVQPLDAAAFGLSLRQQQISTGPEILRQEAARPQKRNQPNTIGREMVDPQQSTSTAQPGQISLKKQKEEINGIQQRKILRRCNSSSQRPKPSKKLFEEMTQ